jgi:cysteinyl-tRNA synthetase
MPARPSESPPAVLDALCDDLNTPLAIAEMHRLADAAFAGDEDASTHLRAAGDLMGLLQKHPDAWFERHGDDTLEIAALVAAREDARRGRNFAEADRLKQALLALGVTLEDRKDGGTTWYRRRRPTTP